MRETVCVCVCVGGEGLGLDSDEICSQVLPEPGASRECWRGRARGCPRCSATWTLNWLCDPEPVTRPLWGVSPSQGHWPWLRVLLCRPFSEGFLCLSREHGA